MKGWNSLCFGGVIVDNASILGGVGRVDARGGGGIKASDVTVPGQFLDETKGMEVSSHYLFYTYSFHVFFECHTKPFGIVHCIIFTLSFSP